MPVPATLPKLLLAGLFTFRANLRLSTAHPRRAKTWLESGMGTADLCYRAEFKTWSTELLITYNKAAISIEQIVNLFRLGGFANGIGDWRPAKDGSFGTFHVEFRYLPRRINLFCRHGQLLYR